MRVKTWISEEKNDYFALDQTTMYGDAMCEPFKMIEQLNGKKPIRTLKKLLILHSEERKDYFALDQTKMFGDAMCDTNN